MCCSATICRWTWSRIACARGGQEVHLGPTEFRLLRHFMQNPGRVFCREQLLDAVWGSDVYVEARTVDVHHPPPAQGAQCRRAATRYARSARPATRSNSTAEPERSDDLLRGNRVSEAVWIEWVVRAFDGLGIRIHQKAERSLLLALQFELAGVVESKPSSFPNCQTAVCGALHLVAVNRHALFQHDLPTSAGSTGNQPFPAMNAWPGNAAPS